MKPEALALETLLQMRGRTSRWYRQQVVPVLDEVRKAGGNVWQGGVRTVSPSDDAPRYYQLYLHGKRGVLYSRVLTTPPLAHDYLALFQRLLDHAPDKPVALVFHGAYLSAVPKIGDWVRAHPQLYLLPWPADG